MTTQDARYLGNDGAEEAPAERHDDDDERETRDLTLGPVRLDAHGTRDGQVPVESVRACL